MDIGSDRQLFLDDTLVETLDGLVLRQHEPVLREIVLRLDKPWEGEVSWCPVILKDGDRYRMWYRSETAVDPKHFYTAYAESPDGIQWHRPELGIVSFDGSTDNNICIDNPDVKNAAVFKDERPGLPDHERYKAVGRWTRGKPSRIYGLVSADGIHWAPAQDGPLVVATDDDPQFDSPLSAFWDGRHDRYVIYVRGWFPDGPERRIRAIRRTTSEDFVCWSPWQYAEIAGEKPWPHHLYTNSGHPYYRAPYYLMFPKRFLPERRFDPAWPHNGLSDVILLAGRDGLRFHRPCPEPLLRPGLDPANWHERSIFIAPHAVKTAEGEMSLYSVQNYRTDGVHIRRLTLREDGFVSVHASSDGGILLTRPFVFAGDALEINYATSAAGDIRVGLMDDSGQAVPGFSADDCHVIYGDEISRTVTWSTGQDVSAMAGRSVHLLFHMHEADLFSFRFVDA